MRVEELTSEEFQALVSKVKGVIISIGSIEAHGPHLPLGTDLFTIYEICQKLIKEVDFLLAPPLYYGLCRSTKDIPGTLSIKGETLKALILDLLESFKKQGINTFAILSGHAGGTHNTFLIDAAEAFLEKYPDTKILVADIISLLKDILIELNIPPEDSHAGEWETSLMLYLKGDLVKNLEKAFEDYPKFPKFQVVSNKKPFWSSGIWGNPKKASYEKGKILTEKLISKLKTLLNQL
ncbi:MAG: creatininase family protein [Caldimicrobium sp.]